MPDSEAASLIKHDPTLDPGLRSWVESANDPASDFPLQNLPLGMMLRGDGPGADRPVVCAAIGDSVLDIDLLFHSEAIAGDDEAEERLLDTVHEALHAPVLTPLARLPAPALALLRRKVQGYLAWTADAGGQSARRVRQKAVIPAARVRLLAPCAVHNYTDFYASVHHATNVGSMFRPDNPLLPNYKHVPIGYHGRASSIVVSGTPVRRPWGQTMPEGAAQPVFGPCKRLDYELEVGCYIGRGNALGEPLPIAQAEEHIFGLCLLNDWSARDVQAWEYQPLGPFLAKNFASTVSPWVVSRAALAPFRVSGPARSREDPAPLPYLTPPDPRGGFDVVLEVLLSSAKMREAGHAPLRASTGNLRDMYWTFAQMIAHHASNGCNLKPTDLLGSGTVSGPGADSRGCLLERTWAGIGPDKKPLPRVPLELPTGEKRLFLEDGDEVIFRGWCQREGFRRIGFGECRGTIEPAHGPG